MKVLYLLSIHLDRKATSGHILFAVLHALCKSGNTVHILQMGNGSTSAPTPEELARYPVTISTIPCFGARKKNFIARYWSEMQYMRACEKQIREEYDAVFVQSTTNAGSALKSVRKKLPRAKVTLNVQDVFPYNAVFSGKIRDGGLAFRLLRKKQHDGYRHADSIITISEDMKDLLVQDGVPAEKIDVIYNWSYRDEPYTELDLSAVGHLFDPQKFNVVYAGNIGVMQNVELLVEAANLMKCDTDVRFLIIGEGVQKELLEKRARDYGLCNVLFWPMQPPELAPYLYSAASVNVIPLGKNIYQTALPSKTATCLACGRPIIFAVGKDSRFAQMLAKEAGCIVTESDDPNELAEAIRSIRDCRAPAQAMTSFFEKNCSITKNSLRYAEIITAGNGG